LVMSLHVEALAVAFMDATRQRSKPIKLAKKRDGIVEAFRIRRIGRFPCATARRYVASRTNGMLKARALPAIWKDRGGISAGGAVLNMALTMRSSTVSAYGWLVADNA
jgi:hypothetical protein